MVPTMPPDSHKISLKIIEAIKQHPVLYSAEVKGSSVKLQEFRQKVWKRISDELGLDPTWVRLRWKNLRDTYCRILKYKNKTEKGVRRKKWIFEDHLSFLKFPYESDYQPQSVELTEDYIQDINAGGISSEGLLEQLEDRNDEDYSEYLEVLEETTADPILDHNSVELNDNGDNVIKNIEVEETMQHDIDTYTQQIQSKYRKIRPKKMKVESLEVPTTYSILKTSSFKNKTVDTPIFVNAPTNSPTKNVAKVEGQDKTSLTLKDLKNNVVSIKEALLPKMKDDDEDLIRWMGRPPIIPQQCDVVIIGGGAMGSSIAYWLKKRVFKDLKVIVIERDPTYTKASTVLSCGGLRQQFSLTENIEMSLFGAEFIRNINDYLGVGENTLIDPYFQPNGYLMLASKEGAEVLSQNSKLQNFLGAKNILLTAQKLKDMFSWLNTEDIELGCLGLEKEGWFDPWAFLSAIKKKAMVLGAEYITAEAQGFAYKNNIEQNFDLLDALIVKTPEGETHKIKFSSAVVAAGAFSGNVAKMAKLGAANDIRRISLPVEPRKRYVYCFHCLDGPSINTPITIDYTGTYFSILL
ncbi:FAD-dependent oxidoreductase domain-containing protein 1 isoform X2 [Megachile rotundata]|uniref:FAD-dependent oxidoreductase domain-containing protein 1 isoform X2 n=1 Tax=Megachile rotundata TaxID=143995 RepID=UPI000615180D|nr:PREDICTED: FAD-dependent oxidoreductase domain-containing protein 1-like isoform X2 [Megachile rotundata]